MPSPFVHSLLPPACALTVQQTHLSESQARWPFKQWFKFLGLSVFLANLPDIDVFPAMLFSEHYQEIHRAWGHNVFVAIFWIYFGAWCLKKFVSSEFSTGRATWISFCLVASHLFLDATPQHSIFASNPAVPLFWPLTNRLYTIPLSFFETMNFTTTATHLLSVPFTEVWHLSFWREIIQCELIPSFLLYCTFWTVAKVFQFARIRFSDLRANKYGPRKSDDALLSGNNL